MKISKLLVAAGILLAGRIALAQCNGNGVCEPVWGEDACSCPDCPFVCGDGCCSEGENWCLCDWDCGPTCGDGCCAGLGWGEDCRSCGEECDFCGDGCCGPGETWCNCPQDGCAPGIDGDGCCHPDIPDRDCDPLFFCGDSFCDRLDGENCNNCSWDCWCDPWLCGPDGECTTCNDGICDPGNGEDCANCPEDCGCPEPWLFCDAPEGFYECVGCGNFRCERNEDCNTCPNDCGNCCDFNSICDAPRENACNCWDCLDQCGDGCCSPNENSCDCPEDCGWVCGDGCCTVDHGESCLNCPGDCGDCCDFDGTCEPLLGENACNCASDGCQDECGDNCCGLNETSCGCPLDCGWFCGDGCCSEFETACDCPQDCGARCGDGCCSEPETTCQCGLEDGCPWAVQGDACCDGTDPGDIDCFAVPQCGDGICDRGGSAESCVTCVDCACGPGEYCDVFGECVSVCDGDGSCEGGENCGTCESDCKCPDGWICEASFGQCIDACGDGICDPGLGESCITCPWDCGECCNGDGICDAPFEDACNCESDCYGCCPDATCRTNEDPCSCPVDCTTTFCGDGCCYGGENPCGCPDDCADTTCGDGCCHGDENPCSCPDDCNAATCGDGCCSGAEDSCECPEDCGSDCGDGCCNGGENACSGPGCVTDCGHVCGDGCCSGTETPCGCSDDCSEDSCGDGCCGESESCSSCPEDCQACPDMGTEPQPDMAGDGPASTDGPVAGEDTGTGTDSGSGAAVESPYGCRCRMGTESPGAAGAWLLPSALLLGLWIGRRRRCVNE